MTDTVFKDMAALSTSCFISMCILIFSDAKRLELLPEDFPNGNRKRLTDLRIVLKRASSGFLK